MSDKARTLTIRLDEETAALLTRCSKAEERDVAQQARYFIKRALEGWAARNPEVETEA